MHTLRPQMAIYLVTPLTSNFDQLGHLLRDIAGTPDNIFELQHRAGYLINFSGTSVDLSHKLGITSPEPGTPPANVGPALITSVSSYYGLGSTAMWEWLKVKIEAR